MTIRSSRTHDRPAFNPSVFMGSAERVRHVQRKYAQRFRGGQRVLDLGCGIGVFLRLLRDEGVEAVGVDAFPDCVDECHANGLTVVRADLLDYIGATTDQYDGVFCSHIVEHLTPNQLSQLLDGIARVLKLDGQLIIITPNFADLEVMGERFWLDVTHVRPYPGILLRKLIEHVGLKVEKVGFDADTRPRLLSRKPLYTVRQLIRRLLWGANYGTGDTVVIARKSARI